MINRKITSEIVIGIVLLICVFAGSIFYYVSKLNGDYNSANEQSKLANSREDYQEEKDEQKDEEQHSSDSFKKEFNSSLGNVKVTKIFSIPKYQNIPSFCPICKEQGIDSIEGQYWQYAVSPDHKQSAYTIQNEKETLVLNGKEKSSYDDIYFLKFSPDGKKLAYHAYDKKNKSTYLVINEEKIFVYPGREGWPHAANGVSEEFSRDGKRFAYAKVPKDRLQSMEIFLDGKKINDIEGELIRFSFSEDGNILRYNVSGRGSDDHRYYENNELKEKISLEEFNEYFAETIYLRDRKVGVTKNSKGIIFDGEVRIDYSNENPEVYINSLITNTEKNNLAYIVTTNEYKNEMRVSLNGNDAEEKFNDIRNLEFSSDGKKLNFVARKGRDFFSVSYDIIDYVRSHN